MTENQKAERPLGCGDVASTIPNTRRHQLLEREQMMPETVHSGSLSSIHFTESVAEIVESVGSILAYP